MSAASAQLPFSHLSLDVLSIFCFRFSGSANGHVRFAERWLIRFEHELSQRSRQVMRYHSTAGDLISGQRNADEAALRVMYGDANSAAAGGIDYAPRYGAAPMSTSSGAFGKLPSESNRWRHWKTLFANHTTPRNSTNTPRSASPTSSHARRSSAATDKSSLMSLQKPQRFRRMPGLPRSRSSNRLKESARGLLDFPDSDPPANRVSIVQAPPVPPLPSDTTGKGTTSKTSHKAHGSESIDRETYGWNTESSLSSHASTAATSLGVHQMRPNSTSLTGPLGLGGPNPNVTSEVLMAADKPTQPGQALRPVPVNGVLPTSVSQPIVQRSSVSDTTSAADEPRVSPIRPPRHSSRVVSRLPNSTSSPIPRSQGPRDVPQDEASADSDLSSRSTIHPSTSHSGDLITRQRPQAAESGVLTRSGSSQRRESPFIAPAQSVAQLYLRSTTPDGRRGSTGSAGSSASTATGPALTAQALSSHTSTPVGTGPSTHGLDDEGKSLGALDDEHRQTSVIPPRLGSSRKTSSTDGIYRISNLSIDNAEPSLHSPFSSHERANDSPELSSTYEYYQSLSPRPRSSRLFGTSTPPAQRTRQASGPATAVSNHADGDSPKSGFDNPSNHQPGPLPMRRVRRKEVPVLVASPKTPASSLAEADTQASKEGQQATSQTSPPANEQAAGWQFAQGLEPGTSPALLANVDAPSQKPFRDANGVGDDAHDLRNVSPRPPTPPPKHDVPTLTSPSATQRWSSTLASPPAGDTGPARRLSATSSACSMGTFGRRGSDLLESSDEGSLY